MKAAILPALIMLLTQTASALSDCQSEALRVLHNRDAKAFRLYSNLRTDSKETVLPILTCRKPLIAELSSFVQGASLMSAYDFGGVVLVSGETVTRGGLPQQMLAPQAMLGMTIIDREDPIVKTYLMSSSRAKLDFFVLLDVMNAHTHELQTAVNLHALLPGTASVGVRDRLAGVMNLVKTYLELARTSHKLTWDAIGGQNANSTKNTVLIQKLWAQAESTLRSSCRNVHFGLGVRDVGYLEQIYSLTNMTALQTILNYVPDISAECRNANR